MRRFPKVPDILKIPKENELSYTRDEFNALEIALFSRPARYASSGLGGKDFIIEMVPKMLSTPLDFKTISYRGDFFTELMSKEEMKKELKLITRELPDKNPIRMNPFSGTLTIEHPLELQAQRLIDLPDTLEALIRLEGTSKLYKDLRKFTKKLMENTPEFVAITRKIRDEYPLYSPDQRTYTTNGRPRAYKTKKNSENLEKIASQLAPFLGLLEITKGLKKQLTTYLLFSYLCEGGCKPEFLDPEKREGHIINGFHLGYASRTYKKDIGRYGKDVWERPIPNDAQWGPDNRLTLITGANSRGKSVYLRMIGLNLLLAMNGFYALADEMKLSPVRRVWPCFDFGDKPGKGHLETGLTYVAKMRDYVIQKDFLLIDEPSQGTEPIEEYKLAKGLISNVAYLGEFNSYVVSHDISMVHELEGLPNVRFRRVADYDDEKNKFRLLDGISETGYGMRLAKNLGTDPDSLEKRIKERIRQKEL